MYPCFRKPHFTATLLAVLLLGPTTLLAQNCLFEVTGTTVPNTSGTPLVINPSTGTVISANFFNGGAIDPPYFDGQEFVSLCVESSDENGEKIAVITTDVGLDNDTIIKGYPQFLIGSKFGNQYETSFRYYQNDGLPLNHQWPVSSTNLASNGTPFQFANLEYVSQVKGVNLPAFTNNLPEINVVIDIDEQNIVGAERDVMLESWFYDTSANSQLIGNNQATGLPLANTLNNIVGIGHPHYTELNNTLLEMMVHIGALSPNDVSESNRNPGQNQLTENYSGKDFDGDGIDDHFDVDSHINFGTNIEPQPGIYSSGIDNNNDGIDDADLLPITIGDYQYSIWYGTSYLAPIVIYSRETDSSLTSDFDPLTPDMNLTTEGEIELPWNEFLDYTLYDLETKLQSAGVTWASGADNPFSKMSAQGGAIGGIELGVEPQINSPSDLPYYATINKFDVQINGTPFGLSSTLDTLAPTVEISPFDSPPLTAGSIAITGTSNDNVAVDRIRLLIKNTGTGQFWNGTSWTSTWSWFAPNGTNEWSYNLSLPVSNFSTRAWAWDTSNNRTTSATETFSTVANDTTPPVVQVTPLNSNQLAPGIFAVAGTSSDDVAIDRIKVLIKNTDTGQFWNGTTWTTAWSWFAPSGTNNWTYSLTLPAGTFTTTAWAWDTSNNRTKSAAQTFSIAVSDETPPTVNIISPTAQSSVSTGDVYIYLESTDNVAIDRNKILIRNLQSGEYWNGQQWDSNWSWFSPDNGTLANAYTALTVYDAGLYRIVAWTWDTSGNQGQTDAETITIVF